MFARQGCSISAGPYPLCPAAVLSCGENGEEWCSIESLITFDAGMGSELQIIIPIRRMARCKIGL